MGRSQPPAGVVQLDLFATAPSQPETPPAQESVSGPTKPLDLLPPLTELAVLAGQALGVLSADDQRYLRGPIIFHPGSDDCPDWLRAAIPSARLTQSLSAQGREKSLATLEEALAYLSSASLAFPLASDDAEVFFWLGQELCPRYGLAQDEPVWKSLGYGGPITLTPFLTSQLDELRAKIRAAVIKHAKRQESEARAMEKQAHALADSPRD
jgi:hypothetical protein